MKVNGEIIRSINDKKPIFTVTAGRTGTTYVSRLFGLLPETHAVHEAPPNFVSVMRRAQLDPQAGLTFCANIKLPHIARTKEARYVETSHVFCKGFLECFLKLGVMPQLLLLQRAPRKVALSLLSRNTIPARTSQGWKYLLAPGDRGVLPLDNWQLLTDYQLCFWYCLEIERRQALYERSMSQLGGVTFRIDVDSLKDYETFSRMAATFGYSWDKGRDEQLRTGHASVSVTTHNPNQKNVRIEDLQLRDWEEVVWDIVGYSDPGLRASIECRYAGKA